MEPDSLSPNAPKAWDPRPGEPYRWYQRFRKFLEMGPGRTIEAVWRTEPVKKDRPRLSKRPTATWYKFSGRWEWKARAAAYDLSPSGDRIPAPAQKIVTPAPAAPVPPQNFTTAFETHLEKTLRRLEFDSEGNRIPHISNDRQEAIKIHRLLLAASRDQIPVY